MTEPSNWTKAHLAEVKCPVCGASNRPGVIYVEVDPSGRAFCTVCAALFVVKS